MESRADFIAGKHVEFWLNGEKTVEFGSRLRHVFAKTVELSKITPPILVEWSDGHIVARTWEQVSFSNVKNPRVAN